MKLLSGDGVLSSTWYAHNLGPPWVPIEDAIEHGRLSRFVARFRFGRGVLMHVAARKGLGIALVRNERGALTALWLAALTGRSPVVLLEMIPNRPPRARWKRLLVHLWGWVFERPGVRRGMTAGQAMSRQETTALASLYDVAPERFPHVGFALCRTGQTESPPAAQRSGVLASGRAACDWETLFAAACEDWDLTVVCGASDRARVEELNRVGSARVLSEITRAEHDEEMRRAAVYVMALKEERLSSGQVRLQTATELGAPVVVSRISTLADYVVDGETAIQVPVGDPQALRSAVQELLANPEDRDRLARAAIERARSRTYPDYFRGVKEMVESALQRVDQGR
jgi:hypothetical protein